MSPITSEMQRTFQLGDPVDGETPEQAYKRAVTIYHSGMMGDLGLERQAVIMCEAEVYGLEASPESTPELLKTRRQHIETYDRVWSRAFAMYAPILSNRLAADVANQYEEPAAIEDILLDRLRATWTKIIDPLLEDQPRNSTGVAGLADFDGDNRCIGLNYGYLIAQAATTGTSIIDEQELDRLMQHEILHALFAAWYDPESRKTLSNGLEALPVQHGEWVNEGTIEKYLGAVYPGRHYSYTPGVLALTITDGFDLEFETARLRAAVFNEGRGTIMGGLEILFGPGAPEYIMAAIDEVASSGGLAGYRERLLSLLPRRWESQAHKTFDKALFTMVINAVSQKPGAEVPAN